MASYKYTPAHPSAPHRVYHRGKSYWFKTKEEAMKRINLLATGVRPLSPREVDEYRHAKELLQGVPLLTAIRFYQEGIVTDPLTVHDAIERHMTAASGRPDYLEKKRYFLGKLEAEAGKLHISMVTPTLIERTMLAIKSDWMKNDFLRHVRILYRYLIRMRLTRNDPTAGLIERKVQPSKVILSLPDVDHLLETCEECMPEILPAIALQLFMGIRTSEVMRLEWSGVKIGEFVNIEERVSKTKERRVIDWWPKRLTSYIGLKSKGSVIPYPDSYEHHKWELIRLCKKADKKFHWGQNALRHSFASYAVAYWQDAGRVALLMGQRDVNILFRHYRNYRTQQEGAIFFGAQPPAQIISHGQAAIS